MSVYLWNTTAKEGETANGKPGGGTEVGRSPPRVPDLLPNPPHQLFNPTLLSPPQPAQPTQVTTPQEAYFLYSLG